MAAPEPGHLTFMIADADAGRRLDHVLCERLDLSRAAAKRLLDAGLVRVDGRRVGQKAKGDLLRAGQVVEADAAGVAERIVPEALPLTVLAEGDGWLVVDKPAGVPVHPLRPGETGTVLNRVASLWPGVQGVGEGGLRSGVVHRLDVETSGTLAVATSQPAWERLREAFTSRRIEKRYLGIVAGRLEGEGEEAMHLAVTRHKPAYVSVVEPGYPGAGARRCELAWQSRAAGDAASLIEVDLGTGFLHQIRVMLAHGGHPLLGDAHYGGPAVVNARGELMPVPRPMLHAWSLRFEEIGVGCEPPEDFRVVLKAWGWSA